MTADNKELSDALVKAGMELMDVLRDLREMHERLAKLEPQRVPQLREQARGLSRQAGALRIAVGQMRTRQCA
jgi:septal ring factor EnvC (AmiA/AmiB activator)